MMLAIASGNAIAGWELIAGDGNISSYIDFSSIHKSGNFAQADYINDFKIAKTVGSDYVFSLKGRDEFDCRLKLQRPISLTAFNGHMGQGKILFNDITSGKYSAWGSIQNGSIEEIQFKAACNKR